MASASNAFSGAAMSNAQAGTRLTSSGDWTRLKRLRGIGKVGWNAGTPGVNNPSTNPSTPVSQVAYSKAMLIPRRAGPSRIQNTASDWINYRAYNTADYTIKSQQTGTTGKTITVKKLCSCSVPYAVAKQGLCAKCNGTLNK